MNTGVICFARTRREQLTDYLRDQLRSGQLATPLPNTREWAARLGVSCVTLYGALHTLEEEQIINILPRKGVFLNDRCLRHNSSAASPVVRLVYSGTDYPRLPVYDACWLGLFVQRLQAHGIRMSIENCNSRRLQTLCDNKDNHHELHLLCSLSDEHQRMFDRSGQPSLVIGYRAPGVALPYVAFDMVGAIRHATHALLRKGFDKLHLLIDRVEIGAVQRQCDAFESACAGWPRQPVCGESVDVPWRLGTELEALARFSSRISGRHGIITVSPIGIDAVMTSLYNQGVMISDQIGLVMIESLSPPRAVRPMPSCYSASKEALVRLLTHAALHFFQTGVVPLINKTLDVESDYSDS